MRVVVRLTVRRVDVIGGCEQRLAGVRPVGPGDAEDTAHVTRTLQRAVTVADGLTDTAQTDLRHRLDFQLRCNTCCTVKDYPQFHESFKTQQ